MNNRIERAFNDIRADEALLLKTAAYLRAERGKREEKGCIRPLRLAGALAAMLILVVGIFGYQIFYSTAAAYVSIDVNPSVELTLNHMDRVIGVVAYNAEGEALLQKVSLNGKHYGEAATSLISVMEQEGYFGNDAFVTLTVQTEDEAKEQSLCDALLQLVNEQFGFTQALTEVEVLPVSQEIHELAKGCHMSAAKYLAIQELMEVDETATLEEYSGSTIRQIRQRTQTCREEHASNEDSAGNENHDNDRGQGQGNGQGGRHGHGYHGGN